MTIVKEYPTENYVSIHNDVANDCELSFEARGVLLYLLSKSADWNPCQTDIAKQGNLGIHKTKRILAELEAAGYVKKHQCRSEVGRFGTQSMTVYGRRYTGPRKLPEPITCQNPSTDEPLAVNRKGRKPSTVNRATVSPDTKERELKKDKDTKEILESGGKKRFAPPTRYEVESYMVDKGATFEQAKDWSEDFIDFYESKGWMVGKNKMKSWTNAASRWTKKNISESKATENGNANSKFGSPEDWFNVSI